MREIDGVTPLLCRNREDEIGAGRETSSGVGRLGELGGGEESSLGLFIGKERWWSGRDTVAGG